MCEAALNTDDRILLKVPTSSGWEWFDPMLVRGATFFDVANEATYRNALDIVRFDGSTLTGEIINERAAPYFSGDFDNPPLWVKDTPFFKQMAFEEEEDRRNQVRHERSFKSPSIYRGVA
nr:hypothetical protein [Brucella anthropi]